MQRITSEVVTSATNHRPLVAHLISRQSCNGRLVVFASGVLAETISAIKRCTPLTSRKGESLVLFHVLTPASV